MLSDKDIVTLLKILGVDNEVDGLKLLIRMTMDGIQDLAKYKEAILWLYSQTGHQCCHSNALEMFRMVGLGPPDMQLPPREEFRQKCQEYEEEIYEHI